MTTTVIAPTGTANLASMRAALTRIGHAPAIATDAGDVASADWVVVPGVGSFGAAMATIDERRLRQPLRERIATGKPTLMVCVGMQLLCAESEESIGSSGLETIPDKVSRFSSAVRVPQMGWNRVTPTPGFDLVEPGWAYFANSYRLPYAPSGWEAAVTDYDGDFVSALRREGVLACQFHPELSGHWGQRLLQRWFDSTAVAA